MPPHRYLLFNKPYGVLSQFTDDRSPAIAPTRSTLAQFITVPEVYPVGRLDHDSEGLMLLTSDGALQHRLSHPKFEHPRTYWAQVEGIPAPADLQRLRQGGVTIQDYQTRPIAITALAAPTQIPDRDPPVRFRQAIPTSWLSLTLTEGRNRQVRRMTAAIGYPTLRLVRVSIGHLSIEHLSIGQWRDLTPTELNPLDKLMLTAYAKPKARSRR